MRRPLPATALYAAAAALLVAASLAVFASAMSSRHTELRHDTAAEEHVANVEALAGEVHKEVESVSSALTEAVRHAAPLPHGSPEMIAALTTQVLASQSSVLNLTVMGVARHDGSYVSVGTNFTAGRIAVGRVVDGQLVYTAIDGGAPTAVGPFPVTERDWFTSAATVPDTEVWTGPYATLEAAPMLSLSIAEPGSSLVFHAGVDQGRFVTLVGMLARAANLNAVVVTDGGDGIHRAAGHLSAEEVTAALERPRIAGQAHLRDGAHNTSVVEILNGTELVTMVVSSPPAPAQGYERMAVFVTPVGAALTLIAAVLGAAAAGPLRRLRSWVRRDGSLSPQRSRISELDRLASALEAVEDSCAAEVAQLSALHSRTVSARDLSERWIATQLHDGPLQRVAAARIAAELGGSDDEVVAELRAAESELRALAMELVPDLSANGLEGALRTLAERASSSRFEVVARVSELGDLDRPTQRLLLRAAAELVTNAKKHSAGTTATVSVSRAADNVTLEVADNGAGFPPGAIDGFGLASLRVQVAEAGGTLRAGPRNGGAAGSVVSVTVPVGTRADGAAAPTR